jgi:hypothetical protein
MTLLGWAVVALVIGALTLGLGGVLVDLGHRAMLFGGEILLWIGSVLGG